MPPTGETRAQILADYCAAEGLRLEESIAYADSTSDLPMLEAVGFPVAVNPETRLAAIARKRGWLVEHWSKAAGRPTAAAADRPAAAASASADGSSHETDLRAQAGEVRGGPVSGHLGTWQRARQSAR